jgi:uncharacterized membrane protein (DUF485 family)
MVSVNSRSTRPAARSNSRLGSVLFVIYVTLYTLFVLLNAFAPSIMDRTPLAGINVAILYGVGLIFAALVLALIYGAFSGPAATDGGVDHPEARP